MNILTEKLPSAVNIGGVWYPIKTSFREWVKLELMLTDDDLNKDEKAELALNIALYNPVNPLFTLEALEEISLFYQCKWEQVDSREENINGEEQSSEPIYSFEHDANYIYAAFMGQYGIDLQEVDLHWWKFKALMQGLKEDNQFVKIMGYRSMTISANMSNEQKEFYNKMKKLYALPIPKNEQEKINAIEAALMGDGDLSGVL